MSEICCGVRDGKSTKHLEECISRVVRKENDRAMLRRFGMTEKEAERIAAKVESGDLSDFDMSKIIKGKPCAKMQ